MARPLRIEYEGAFYHVTARGNERGKIFFTKKDYEKFKEYILEAKEKYKVILHAYVLMTNHYHMIVETSESSLSKVMHFINASYTTYINVKRKRSGHLLQGRYKAILIDKDNYLLVLSRYLHLNPVRAKMVLKPEEYLQSSYRSYVTEHCEDIVSKDTILDMMTDSKRDAPGKYRIFVESLIGEEAESPFKDVYGGIILGTSGFIRDTLSRLESKILDTPDVSHSRAFRSLAGLEEIMSACCEHFGVSKEEMVRKKRDESRRTCIYLMKKHTCATNREIARLFGSLSDSAVAKISQKVSKEVEADKGLRERVKTLRDKYSLFKT